MAGNNPFTEFLNTTGASGAGFQMVKPSSPVQWGTLIVSVFGSIYAAVVFGVQAIVNALLGLPEAIVDALTGLIYTPASTFRFPGGKETVEASGIIPTVQRGLVQVLTAAVDPVTGFGWLTWPLVIAEILVVFYIINWSVAYAREEVF